MYYEPNARITIAGVQFTNVNQITITKGIREMSDGAVVKLPRNYKVIDEKSIFDYIKVGDSCKVEIGVDGDYFTEFEGYLKKIGSDIPLELEFEDEFYKLKQTNLTKSYASVNLIELLKDIAADYEIEAPDVNLGAFQINNISAYQVLIYLKENYGLYTSISDNVLKCSLLYDLRTLGNEHIYEFGKNIKKSQLVYQKQEDLQIKIKAIANNRSGKKTIYEVGSKDADASVRTLNFGDISEAELKKYADNAYKSLNFDGYTGSITGFGKIRTQVGDNLRIIDDQYPDREGKYFIEAVNVRYDLSRGFERENRLSFKL